MRQLFARRGARAGRWPTAALAIGMLVGGAAMAEEPRDPAGFPAWIQELRTEAIAAGVRAEIFDAAFADVRINARVVELDQRQPEFSTTIWSYLDRAISDRRVTTGREKLASHATTLGAVQDRYGVPPEVVVAIWGVESNFGDIRGDFSLIPSLATLAYNRRRSAFWRQQIIAALKILQAGDVPLEGLKGSWAGAMGHTQFMPTSYQAYAVDFDGDGRRDIWSDDPVDALASAANYLAEFDWRRGEPWGFPVRLPDDFDYDLIDRGRLSTAEWARIGLRLADGSPLPTEYADAELIIPAGARGPAFLTLQNFRSILRYNNATSYAMAVSLLSERIAGSTAHDFSWPTDLQPLSRDERRELQTSLTELGFDTQGVDGMIGANSRDAIRGFQRANSMVADGYPSDQLLRDVRRALAARRAPLLDIAVAAGPAAAGDVREIQALLTALGYDVGGIDGRAGPRTTRAIERYLRSERLEMSTEPTQELLAALRRTIRSE